MEGGSEFCGPLWARDNDRRACPFDFAGESFTVQTVPTAAAMTGVGGGKRVGTVGANLNQVELSVFRELGSMVDQGIKGNSMLSRGVWYSDIS
jgi:hypothetical protein